MPGSSRKRAAAPAEDYASDDGFVIDDGGDKAPRSKKIKQATTSTKQEGTGPSTKALVDDDGNEYWELSNKRRVQVSEFGKMTYVNIREFYEAGGKAMPGKKGIALPIEQFNALIAVLPQIEKALQAKVKDAKIARPQYDSPGGVENHDEQADVEEGESDGEADAKQTGSALRRANHEATSSEDEG